MPPRPQLVDQLGLDEKVVEIPALESALEDRQAAKEGAGEARRAYAEADEAAKAEIERLELPDGMVVRAGRFRIERRHVAGRSVSFETSAKSRVSISLVDED